VEGAVIQGIGWSTVEEVVYDLKGCLLSDTLTTYKVSDLHSTPDIVEVTFLEDAAKPAGIMDSKAVGEPPFMYGIGAFFAIRDAARHATSLLHGSSCR
jgi:xanthine dehydrogenase large subunit